MITIFFYLWQMSRRRRFIEDLTEQEIDALKQGRKADGSYQFRDRCHAILLSFSGKTADEISALFEVQTKSVYSWFDRWEDGGISSLKNKSGQGRKPKISLDNQEHSDLIEIAAKNAIETGANIRDEILEKIQPEGGISQRTIRRIMRKKTSVGREFVISRKKSRPK